MFDEKLLEIIVCPVSKGKLIYDKEEQTLISQESKLRYPIKNGVPILIPEEAIEIKT